MDQLVVEIKQLELKLLHADWRANPAAIDELLDESFEEISSNGQTHTRLDVVNWLLSKEPQLKWSLLDFRIKQLSDDVVIAMYCAVKTNEVEGIDKHSVRSSIWQRFDDHWRLVFHQATKCI